MMLKRLREMLTGSKQAAQIVQPALKPSGLNAAKAAQAAEIDPFEFSAPMVGSHAQRVVHSHGHSHTHGGHTHTHNKPTVPTAASSSTPNPKDEQ